MADEDFTTREHVEPVHYEKYGFCRQPCEECDRLDHEEREDGMPSAEALARGVAMAFEAAEAEREGPVIPDPLNLTPFHPGHYRSIACPELGCRWHTHYTDPAEGDAKYRVHYEMVHGSNEREADK